MAVAHQGRLSLVRSGAAPAAAAIDQQRIAALTADLVRFPTQGGIDPQAPALHYLADWLDQAGVPSRLYEAPNRRPKNRAIGLLAEIGPPRGPAFALTACLDTAVFGEPDTWEGCKPTAALVTDGWMVGRGTADSKVGVAIFCMLMAELRPIAHTLQGRLLLLLDSDEHTGRFGAVKQLTAEQNHIKGVYIGYPGNGSIKIGARGFYRAKVSLYGVSSHSGASQPSRQNAVEKAARLVTALTAAPLPDADDTSDFGIGPQKTCTAITGGRGYSSVPDYCFLRVDYRLTPTFTKAVARQHLRALVEEVDRQMPTDRASRIEAEQSWPAYRLGAGDALVRALRDAAAAEFGTPPELQVSGPSNVGNFLSSFGIDATCGFGVTCRNVHGANEAIKLDTIMPVYRSYRAAVLKLLT